MQTTEPVKRAAAGSLIYTLSGDKNFPGCDSIALATIVIGRMNKYGSSSLDASVKVTMQANKDEANATTGELRYYGASIVVEQAINRDSALDAMKLGARICSLFMERDDINDLDAMVSVIEELKAKHCHNDRRFGAYCPVDDVLPAEYSTWRDDWNNYDYASSWSNGCNWSADARSEQEAKAIITLKALSSRDGAEDPRYRAWLKAGQPVIDLGGSGYTYAYQYQYVKPTRLDSIRFLDGKRKEELVSI